LDDKPKCENNSPTLHGCLYHKLKRIKKLFSKIPFNENNQKVILSSMSCERNNFFDTKNNASSTCTVVVAVSRKYKC
jgi:hypothetical protein